MTNGITGDTPAGTMPSGGGDVYGIGALITAGAGLYDSYQNRKTSKENTDKTIAAQKAESELAYQRSVQMWNMQNQYNSPAAQMARFSAAGLNPNLIYGQGNSGNASSFPQYQPADIQYKYAAPSYGSAIQSILPTLMAVGSWMQNMRLTDAQLRKVQVDTDRSLTETDRAKQLIDFLQERNPQLLRGGENALSLFPYQKQAIDYNTNISRTKLFELEQDFRQKYGQGLFDDMGSAWQPQRGSYSDIGGTKRLQFLQEASKTKLLDAKSSWTDMNITDPQAIMQMVFQGVMGLAGQTLRLSTHRRPKVTTERIQTTRGGRSTTTRRIHE